MESIKKLGHRKESLGLSNRYTAKIYKELATAKPIVEFLLKWVWVFFNTKAI
jgi:hypothetical protein